MGIPGSANPLLFGGEAQAYEIEQGLRFSGDEFISRQNPSSTATSTTTFTHSFWVKRGSLGSTQQLAYWIQGGAAQQTFIAFDSSDRINVFYEGSAGASVGHSYSSARYRDPSAWYHIVWATDTTATNTTDRWKVWINGEVITAWDGINHPSQNLVLPVNHTGRGFAHGARYGNEDQLFSGYIAESYFVDGQFLDQSNFGEYDDSGVWRPISYSGTYGARGWYLPFAASDIYSDESGNNQDFAAFTGYVHTTSGTGTDLDVMDDTPTNNFATNNPVFPGSGTTNEPLLNGNLEKTSHSTYGASTIVIPPGGKYYMELKNAVTTSPNQGAQIRLISAEDPTSGYWNRSSIFYNSTRRIGKYTGGETVVSDPPGVTLGANSYLQVAIDRDAGKVWYGVNNSWYDTATTTNGNPSSGTNPSDDTLPSTGNLILMPTVAATSGYSIGFYNNYGQRPFNYTPPTGFGPLSTAQLPDADVLNPSDHFQTILAPGTSSGNGTPQGVLYKTSSSADASTFENLDHGRPATEEGNDSAHPMFAWAANLTIGGFSDWYIPAKNELNKLYTSYKGNEPSGQAMDTSKLYRSSSQNSSYTVGNWCQDFGNNTVYGAGAQLGDVAKNSTTGYSTTVTARAIRRETATGSEPSVGTAYKGGYYAGTLNGYALIAAPKDPGEYGVGDAVKDVAQTTFTHGLWWIKDRQNGSTNHQVLDSMRSNSAWIMDDVAQSTYSEPSGASVAWCWSAPDAWSNSSGSNGADVDCSGYRNLDAGFSLCQWTGNRPGTRKVHHGLSQTPEFIITRCTTANRSAVVYHKNTGTYYVTYLDSYYGGSSSNDYRVVNSQIVEHGNTSTGNETGTDGMMMYAWHSVPGYSAFGSYYGNGSSSGGPFSFTGFRPSWIIIKGIETSGGVFGYDWRIIDVKRDVDNPAHNALWSNQTSAEGLSSSDGVDILSNGFKIRSTDNEVNNSGREYIWAAFAEHPFGGANVSPSPAR